MAEMQRPSWWSAAVWRRAPNGNWRFVGYTEPRWEDYGSFLRRTPRDVDVQSTHFRWDGVAWRQKGISGQSG
jgi:hypothetical protein